MLIPMLLNVKLVMLVMESVYSFIFALELVQETNTKLDFWHSHFGMSTITQTK